MVDRLVGDDVDRLFLAIPAERVIAVDERGVPTGEERPAEAFRAPFKIGKTAMDACFSVAQGKGIAVTELHDAQKDLKIRLWQETGEGKYNYLQAYIPPERRSIALEPMTCNIDAFNNLEGLIVLEPGKIFRASYGASIL